MTPHLLFFNSLLLSLSFAKHHLGLAGVERALDTGRVTGLAGLAKQIYASKRKLVQRPPLTVEQLCVLEALVALFDKGR